MTRSNLTDNQRSRRVRSAGTSHAAPPSKRKRAATTQRGAYASFRKPGPNSRPAHTHASKSRIASGGFSSSQRAEAKFVSQRGGNRQNRKTFSEKRPYDNPTRRQAVNPSAFSRWLQGDDLNVPIPGTGRVPVSRRQFVIGVAATASLVAAGVGASMISSKLKPDDEEGLLILDTPASSLSVADDFSALDGPDSYMALTGDFDLPYGTLLWSNDDTIAACLIPGETGKPLATVSLLGLATGNVIDILSQAIGQDDGFEIYDVRATMDGLIWVEANIISGAWRVYTAVLDGSLTLGEPTLAEEGSADWNMPSIALAAGRGFYQILPDIEGPLSKEDSLLKCVALGSSEPETVLASHGRMATAPYALDDSLVVTPRTDTGNIHYQLTLIDAKTNEIRETLVLPTAMKPFEAGYGNNGFFFSFDAIYNNDKAFSNLGTYTPLSPGSASDYNARRWFGFARTPTAPSAWSGNLFMVKSTKTVCGFSFGSGEYFSFDLESGADTYGEYLASTGVRNKLVTFANVDFQPIDGDAVKRCHVRVWSPLEPSANTP